MAEDAVPVVDLAPVLDVLAELFRIRRLEMQEGVLSGVEIDLLVVNRDLGGDAGWTVREKKGGWRGTFIWT